MEACQSSYAIVIFRESFYISIPVDKQVKELHNYGVILFALNASINLIVALICDNYILNAELRFN